MKLMGHCRLASVLHILNYSGCLMLVVRHTERLGHHMRVWDLCTQKLEYHKKEGHNLHLVGYM